MSDQVVGIACGLALTRRPCSDMGATTDGSLPGGVQRSVGQVGCIGRPAREPTLVRGLDLGKAAEACASKHGRVSAASVLLVHLRALRAHGHLPRISTSVSDTLGTHTFEVSRPDGLESVPGRSPQIRVHVYPSPVHVGPTSFRLGRPRTGLCITCYAGAGRQKAAAPSPRNPTGRLNWRARKMIPGGLEPPTFALTDIST